MNVNTLVGETGPSEIYMKEDGYNLFMIGTTGDRVYDFKLSKKYDITTASLDKRGPTISTVEGSPSGLSFKPDGTIMYICGTTAHRIIQYNMSEAWNVNTATIGLTFNVANALSVTNPQDVHLSRDGNYMYFVDSGSDIIYQLSLTEAWNVNTASYLTQKSILAFDSAFTSMYFNANGTSMFLGGQQNDRIKEFRLSTAWNVNTATIYANSGSFAAFSPGMSGITFANNGSMLYLTDTTYDLIHQLPMTQAWNVNTAFNSTATTGNVMVGLVV
jgi:sugar lactone lactonase YvrE